MTTATRAPNTTAFEEELTKIHMKAHSFSIQPALTKTQVEELRKMSKDLLRAAMYGDLAGVGEMNRLAIVKKLVDDTLNKFKGA
jgi:hypothetical protein